MLKKGILNVVLLVFAIIFSPICKSQMKAISIIAFAYGSEDSIHILTNNYVYDNEIDLRLNGEPVLTEGAFFADVNPTLFYKKSRNTKDSVGLNLRERRSINPFASTVSGKNVWGIYLEESLASDTLFYCVNKSFRDLKQFHRTDSTMIYFNPDISDLFNNRDQKNSLYIYRKTEFRKRLPGKNTILLIQLYTCISEINF